MSRVFRIEERKVRPVFIPNMPIAETRDAKEDKLKEELYQLSRKARRIVAEAQEEREKILSSAQKEAEEEAKEVLNQAREEGFEKGYQEGFSSGLNDAEQYVEEARKILAEAQEAFGRLLEEKEPEILALSLEVAKRIVGESIEEDSELVIGILRKAMDSVRGENHFNVRVKSRYLAVLEGEKDQLINDYNAKSLEIAGDETMDEGVVVRTPHGSVDARLGTQIMNLAQALQERRVKLRERS